MNFSHHIRESLVKFNAYVRGKKLLLKMNILGVPLGQDVLP